MRNGHNFSEKPPRAVQRAGEEVAESLLHSSFHAHHIYSIKQLAPGSVIYLQAVGGSTHRVHIFVQMKYCRVSVSAPQSRQSANLFSCRRNWDSPNPLPAGECASPLVPGGGAHSGGWETSNSDEGTYTVVLCLNMYLWFAHSAVAEFIEPWLGDKVNSGMHRVVHVPTSQASEATWLAGRTVRDLWIRLLYFE
jgi:hypothetical protein